MNRNAARMLQKDRKKFEETARFWTQDFACDNKASENENEELEMV